MGLKKYIIGLYLIYFVYSTPLPNILKSWIQAFYENNLSHTTLGRVE